MLIDNDFEEITIFRQCIRLKDGRRICKPHGQAYKITFRRKKSKNLNL